MVSERKWDEKFMLVGGAEKKRLEGGKRSLPPVCEPSWLVGAACEPLPWSHGGSIECALLWGPLKWHLSYLDDGQHGAYRLH